MEIFSSWMFWVSLFVIVSLFALIGYISENKRKKKEAYQKPVLPLENNDADINGNVADSVDDSATLNLDNGTWDNVVESDVQTVGMDTFDDSYSNVNDETGDSESEQSEVSNQEGVSETSAVESPIEEFSVQETAEVPFEETSVQEATEVPFEETPVQEVTEVSTEEAPVQEMTEVSTEESPVQEVSQIDDSQATISQNQADENSSEIWKS